MTKKLLALAVAGAFAAPFTAAADSVTIYGTLNMSIDFTEADGAANPANNIDSTQQISCSSCNIGFRGEEDLGGGLKAWFQLESGIDPDEGSGTLTSRNSAVGLRGGWGTFLVGRWDTPHKLNINAKTPFFATTTAGYNAILGYDGGLGVAANSVGNFDNRQGNSIQYWSPTFAGGLTGRLMYTTRTDSSTVAQNNGTPNTAGESDGWGVSLAWDAKNLYAGAAYEKHNDAGVGPTSLDQEAYSFNLSYAFMGKYRVGVIYENQDFDLPAGGSTDRDAFYIFAVLPVGPGAIHASYANADDWDGRPDSGADVWSIGYYYDLSKRTKVYIQYTQLDNDSNAAYRLAAGPGNRLQPALGADPQAFSLGVRHQF